MDMNKPKEGEKRDIREKRGRGISPHRAVGFDFDGVLLDI